MQIRIALAGIGGYGAGYVEQLLHASPERQVQLVAGIDPAPERSPYLEELRQAGVPIFADLRAFFAQDSADLVILSTPIHQHAPQTCLALSHAANVLCEKPVAATIQETRQMAEAEQKAGKFVAIGYQWSFAPTIQTLKRKALAGDFGRPKRLKVSAFWPRTSAYYQRNRWAGRIKSETGEWVLDSPVNNALAHYLHNILYLLGPTPNTSIQPVSVQAELYRANPIENYDTAALRVLTEDGAEVLFYGTHPVNRNVEPTSVYEFEQATIEHQAYSGYDVRVRYADGRVEMYDDPDSSGGMWHKLWQSVESVRSGEPVACGVAAAAMHTLCVNGAQESTPIHEFPKELIRQEARSAHETLTWVDGLQDVFTESCERNCLPSEIGGTAWAKPGQVINLMDYSQFPT